VSTWTSVRGGSVTEMRTFARNVFLKSLRRSIVITAAKEWLTARDEDLSLPTGTSYHVRDRVMKALDEKALALADAVRRYEEVE